MENRPELRPYQKDQKSDIYKRIRSGDKRIVCQLSTGGGKTVLFSDIAADAVKKKKRVLILAHRTELILQAAQKIEWFTCINPGIIKAGYALHHDLPIQVGSVQTIHSRKDKYPAGFFNFDIIVVDECHRSVSRSYREIIDMCDDPIILGFTATPIRSDNKGLNDLYQNIVCGITTQELIDQEALCKYRIFAQNSEAADALHPKNAVIAYQKYAENKQNIVFASDVQHSIDITEAFIDEGIKAIHLDGTTPAKLRNDAINSFKSKDLQVLVNCGLFIEGLDVPGIECVQILKPTKSISSYLQILGRGMRPSPGKDYGIFLDHTDGHLVHGHPADFRVWSLDGLIKRSKNRSSEIDDEDIDDEEIIPEPSIFDEEIDLYDVSSNRSIEDQYRVEFNRLIDRASKIDKQPHQIFDQIIKLRPPLFIWYEYSKLCGDSQKWAEMANYGIQTRTIHRVRPPKNGLLLTKNKQLSKNR